MAKVTHKKKFLITLSIILLTSFFITQQIQVYHLNQKIQQLSELQQWIFNKYGVTNIEELEQKISSQQRYVGNPFTTGLWSGQLQAENITGMHYYTYISGYLYNRTDVIANPEQVASYIIWTDGTTVYAKNGTSGQIAFQDGNATNVINNCFSATDGIVFIKKGLYPVATIMMDSFDYLFGSGQFNTILVSSSSGNVINMTGQGGIYHIDINGNSTANHGIYWDTPTHLARIEDVRVRNCLGSGVYIFGGYDITIDGLQTFSNDIGLTIDDVNMPFLRSIKTYSNTNHGLEMKGESSGGILQIDSENNGGWGILMDRPLYWEIYAFVESNTLGGINITGSSGTAGACSIKGRSSGHPSPAIYLDNVASCWVWMDQGGGGFEDIKLSLNSSGNVIICYENIVTDEGTNNLWIKYSSGERKVYVGGKRISRYGFTTVKNYEWVSYGTELSGTPYVFVTPILEKYGGVTYTVSVTSRNSTHFQVGVYWTNGTAINNDAIPIYWYAFVKQP